MFLPDVNLWLALAFESHVHHSATRHWFEGLPDSSCQFCRMTQQGFLRLSTNPKVFGIAAVTMRNAWQLYDELRRDSRVGFAEEPLNMDATWRRYSERHKFSPKIWNDAYLSAFACLKDWQLVTFDSGFTQFADLNCRLLTS
jgi:toxin-antitoxin system PIN domain toxin